MHQDLKDDPLFTAAEFVAVVLQVAAENRNVTHVDGDNCPNCRILNLLKEDEEATEYFSRMLYECTNIADPIGSPALSIGVMQVVLQTLGIGVRLGRAHVENRILSEMEKQ
jgi:hypothetical protein